MGSSVENGREMISGCYWIMDGKYEVMDGTKGSMCLIVNARLGDFFSDSIPFQLDTL